MCKNKIYIVVLTTRYDIRVEWVQKNEVMFKYYDDEFFSFYLVYRVLICECISSHNYMIIWFCRQFDRCNYFIKYKEN